MARPVQERSLRAPPWKARCFGISGGLSVGEWEATTGELSVLATPTVEYTRGPDMGGEALTAWHLFCNKYGRGYA